MCFAQLKINFMQLELLRAIRKEFHATQIELHATPRTLRGLIFAWINFRDFANFWTFREN